MRTRSKLVLTALTAALVMSVSINIAQARQFTTTGQNTRGIWTPLEFTALGGFIRIRCNATLRGSFHYRTFSKTRSLVGYITSAVVTRPCTGGEVWILNGVETLPNGSRPNSLPWHISYDSFTGTLPRIRGIRLAAIGAGYLIIALGNQCLYTTTAASPAFGIVNLNEATGEATSLSLDSSSSIPLSVTLGGSCPASGAFSGTTSTFDDGEGVRITVRLI